MGKKLLVRYQIEGSKERELEVSTPKLLGLLAILIIAGIHTVGSVTNGLIHWVDGVPSQMAASVLPVVDRTSVPKMTVLASALPKPVGAERLESEDRALESALLGSKAEIKQTKVELSLPPEITNFVDVRDVRRLTDAHSMSIHFDILNRDTPYVKGYTYGVAKFVSEDGHEELISSHPGINTERPFEKSRFITGLSYGARNFTTKTINFNRPSETGSFVTAWIVVSRAKDVFVKEVSIHE